jgi:hypothetical protein
VVENVLLAGDADAATDLNAAHVLSLSLAYALATTAPVVDSVLRSSTAEAHGNLSPGFWIQPRAVLGAAGHVTLLRTRYAEGISGER